MFLPPCLMAAYFLLATASGEEDLQWAENPQAWHQQAVRILDHQFRSFAELKIFATNARKAGVSVVQLVGVQKRASCPGPWYGGLQLCERVWIAMGAE